MSSVLLGGVLCALIPLAFHALTGLGVVEAMIASAIMPLVPGLSMTNAVQDILRGDMVSGVTHAARAVMIAALLAGGALIGTHVSSWVGLAGQSLESAPAMPFDLRAAAALLISSLLAGGGFGRCSTRRERPSSGAECWGPRAICATGRRWPWARPKPPPCSRARWWRRWGRRSPRAG